MVLEWQAHSLGLRFWDITPSIAVYMSTMVANQCCFRLPSLFALLATAEDHLKWNAMKGAGEKGLNAFYFLSFVELDFFKLQEYLAYSVVRSSS